jgi:hypothetical protein
VFGKFHGNMKALDGEVDRVVLPGSGLSLGRGQVIRKKNMKD